jgi:hypothetical protein
MYVEVKDEYGIMAVVEITDSTRFWLMFVNLLDLFINCIGLANICLCLRIFFKRPLCHQNLVFLLTSGYGAGGIIVICGMLKCLACVTDFRLLSEFFTDKGHSRGVISGLSHKFFFRL